MGLQLEIFIKFHKEKLSQDQQSVPTDLIFFTWGSTRSVTLNFLFIYLFYFS